MRRCPECDSTLSADSSCVRCALSLALTADAHGDLGDYQLLDRVGQGAMGVVYRAPQRSLNRLVAVKTLRAGLFASDSEVDRFQREARAAAVLSHPNIVRIYEV